MTVEIPQPTIASLRTKRKRKNHDNQDSKASTLQDTKKFPSKEECMGPHKSKRHHGSADHDYLKKEESRGEGTNVLNEDSLRKYELLQKKYGSEVVKDILKTMGEPSVTKVTQDNEMEVESGSSSKTIPVTDGFSSPGVTPADMMNCMATMWKEFVQKLPQMTNALSNVAMNPMTSVTKANSEFVMRSLFNNDDEENSPVNSINSVITTMDPTPTVANTALPPSSTIQNKAKLVPLSETGYGKSFPKVTSDSNMVSHASIMKAVSVISSASSNTLQEIPDKLTKTIVPISSFEEPIQTNQRSVSPRSVNISNPFKSSTQSSKLKLPDHPLVIRGPTVSEKSVIDNYKKPLLIGKEKSMMIDSLNADDEDAADKKMIAACSDLGKDDVDQNVIPTCKEGDGKMITACSDVGKDDADQNLIPTYNEVDKNMITACSDTVTASDEADKKMITACSDIVTTTVNEDTLMKFIQTGETGGSFYAFCDEMNDPEQRNINLLEDALPGEEGKKSPVYEPIITTTKHTLNIRDSDEEDGVHCSADTDVSIHSTSLMTRATGDIVHDVNKSHMNLNCSNTKYSNIFGVSRNSVANTNDESYLNSDCSTTLASHLKPWEYEIAEFERNLRNEIQTSEMLLSANCMNPIYGVPFSSGPLFTMGDMDNNGQEKTNGQSTWYQTCIEKLLLPDIDGDTILHIAIAKEDSRVIELITQMNSDNLNIKNNLGQTPLHIACYVHQTDIISALIQAGADEEIVDENGNTPLHIACDEKSLAMVECLIQCFKDEPTRLKAMMDRHNNYGLTPLHIVVQKQEHDIVKSLVANGCDINIQDEKSGSTVFVYALMSHDRELIRLFIDKGADLNIPTSSALYPLNFAAQTGDIELVKELVARDADIGNKLPEFPACNPESVEMKTIFEKELRKRRRRKKRDENKHQTL